MASRFWLVLVALMYSPGVFAGDHFLTIGGGGGPQNNQFSLERNVVYFQKVLGDTGHAADPHEIYFACGNEDARDLQFVDVAAKPPEANLLLARLFSRDNELYQTYRPHALKNLNGPATRVSVSTWFDTTGKKLAPGDRLFIYFTGHGGGGRPERNTTMDLWQDGGMPVKEFVGLLDKLNPRVQVVLFMVQCHSGGFADVIFKNGDMGPNLTEANRIGFFATWHSRLAAGCTPDTAEENYKDYTTYFYAALSGKTRTGQSITAPDYDGDGQVSMAEAHAYVQLKSDTIDIPVCTSDILLRQFSKTKDNQFKNLVSPDNFNDLLAAATADRAAVLKGLSQQLDLKGNDRVTACRVLADAIEKDRKKLELDKATLTNERENIRKAIRAKVIARWPEMSNAFHPAVSNVLANHPETIVTLIESQPGYKRWEELEQQIDQNQEKSFTLERKWVKAQRFLYQVESVALAANLEKFAARSVVERYQQMRAAESSLFSTPAALGASTPASKG